MDKLLEAALEDEEISQMLVHKFKTALWCIFNNGRLDDIILEIVEKAVREKLEIEETE